MHEMARTIRELKARRRKLRKRIFWWTNALLLAVLVFIFAFYLATLLQAAFFPLDQWW